MAEHADDNPKVVTLWSDRPHGQCALIAKALFDAADLDARTALNLATDLFFRLHPASKPLQIDARHSADLRQLHKACGECGIQLSD